MKTLKLYKTLLGFAICASTLQLVPTVQAASYSVCNLSGCTVKQQNNTTANYAQTRYPLVLVHGMHGFHISRTGFAYFYGISEDLLSNGATVYVPKVSSISSTEVRGEQLIKQLKMIKAISGHQKFNLIGHSHGGPTVRYVGGVAPELTASVTGVGAPIQYIPVSDTAEQIKLVIPKLYSILARAYGVAASAGIDLMSASDQLYSSDPSTGAYDMSSDGLTKFNQRFPMGVPTTACGSGANVVNGIAYYSWSGVAGMTNIFDPIDYAFIPIKLSTPGQSDSIIPKCSSHLGQVIRDDYKMNHMDEVNQFMGLKAFGVNPISVFRQHANRLKTAGL